MRLTLIRLALTTLAFLVLALVLARAAFAVDTDATWQHPTEYEDSSPLPLSEIRETVVQWARCADGLFPETAEGEARVPAPVALARIQGLAANVQWCFRAATIVISDQQSAWSETATGIWLRKPKPPRLMGPQAPSGATTVVIQ